MNIGQQLHLFVSKSVEELQRLPAFCQEANIHLTAHSFLTFEAIPVEVDSSAFDVVFFASPRAAQFFTRQVDCSTKTIAVAGATTKKVVEMAGLRVDFVPYKSGNITESTRAFASFVNGRKVLFPVSTISQKSYTMHLSPTQFTCVEVYKTQISTQKIDNCTHYAFTSPSNVNGFFQTNALPKDAQVYAWGESTRAALVNHTDSHSIITFEDASETELIHHLRSAFAKEK